MTLSHAMPSATELLPLLPELVLIGSAFALLIIDLFIGERHKVWTHFLSVLALVVVLAMLATGSWGWLYAHVFDRWITPLAGAEAASLAMALSFVALWWLPMAWLDRRRIYLKI